MLLDFIILLNPAAIDDLPNEYKVLTFENASNNNELYLFFKYIPLSFASKILKNCYFVIKSSVFILLLVPLLPAKLNVALASNT